MSFEQTIRDRISKVPFRSREKDVFKVVLGEVQQKSATGPVSDEQGQNIVKAMVKNNVEKVLVHLKDGDPRRAAVEEENSILSSLLPTYLTEDEIVERLTDAALTDQLKAAKSEGQATGLAMKYLKGLALAVEGDTVKQAVAGLRG